MTLTATVVCLALSLGAGEPASMDLTPSTDPPPAEINFDTLPPLPTTPDDVRVKRFLGALSGGVVALGASLALMPVGDAIGCFRRPCLSFAHVLIGSLAPLLALGGAWLGFRLMGGDGGLLTPSVALIPALLVALGLLSVAREVDASTAVRLMPFVITAGVFLAGGAALALDLRARQLSRLGQAAGWGSAKPGRVAVTALVSAFAGGGAAALTALLVAATNFSGLGPVMGIVGAMAGSAAMAATTWAVHRAMKGRGTFLAALAGLGLGTLLTAGGAGLVGLSQSSSFDPLRSTAAAMMLVQLGAFSAIFLPTLSLELSHTNAVEASLPKFSFSAAPTPQGGMVGAGLRF